MRRALLGLLLATAAAAQTLPPELPGSQGVTSASTPVTLNSGVLACPTCVTTATTTGTNTGDGNHATQTLDTCTSSIEGKIEQDSTGGATTGGVTKLCACRGNGTGSITNLFLSPSTIGDGSNWVANSSTCTSPNVTVNSADVVAPDGTQTASKFVFPSCAAGGGNRTAYEQPITATAAPYTLSIWAKTNGAGACTTYLSATPDGVTYYKATITATPAWQRFAVTHTLTATSWFVFVGMDSRDGTQSSQAACTVYLAAAGAALSPSTDFCATTCGQYSWENLAHPPPVGFPNGTSTTCPE
jgi:hypothetical protein